MLAIQVIIEYVLPVVALIALGGYLEYRFGAKVQATVSADVAALKADVASLKSKANVAAADVSAAKKAL
jgi:outer membrane murein-binding lipoprotein Lpp